jgi:protein phosphatase
MNKVYIMVGISGAGKSTYVDKLVKNNQNMMVYSSDKLRSILGKDESDQTVTPQVFSTIKFNLDRDLKDKKDVLIDATSLNPSERRDYISIAKKHNAMIIAYVLERDKETLMRNQKSRKSQGGREVPEFVIDKMLKKYVRPSKLEGFDEIYLV